MHKRKILYIFLVLLISGCSSLSKREGVYFNEMEYEILKSTTSAIGYDYGYDSEIEIDYIFSNTYSEADLKDKSRYMKDALKKYDSRALVSFYEKIYRLKVMTLKLSIMYKDDKDWKEYTHITKYLYPALERYIKLLETRLLIRVPAYKKRIKERKKLLDEEDYN